MSIAHTAGDLVFELRVGRRLSGFSLGIAVALRELALQIVTLGGGLSGLLAPSYIIVSDRHTGRRLAHIAAGREADAGAELLQCILHDAAFLSREQLLQRYARS